MRKEALIKSVIKSKSRQQNYRQQNYRRVHEDASDAMGHRQYWRVVARRAFRDALKDMTSGLLKTLGRANIAY